jgi:hypothetical protein
MLLPTAGAQLGAWDFGTTTSRQGFNATGIVIFAGKIIQNLVREVIQNSIDEQVDTSNPVEVAFTIDEVSKGDAPEFWDLKPHLVLAQAEESRSPNGPKSAAEFYEKALNLVEQPKLRVFGIHDANTGGLGGELEDPPFGIVEGGWLSLVRSSGVSSKTSAGALGSFGQGSKAVFAFSNLRSVAYYTETVYDNAAQHRYQPKCYLQTMSAPNPDRLTSEVGYYQNAAGKPFLDAEIAPWPRSIRDRVVSGTGTSLYVPAPKLPDDSGELWFYVKVETIANFYYAILNNHLAVTLDNGERISAETIDHLLDAVVADDRFSKLGDEVANKFESVRTIREGLLSPSTHGVIGTSNFGPMKWFIRIGGDVSKRKVGVARGLGMLITREADGLKQFSNLKPFEYFVSVENKPGTEILRRFEPPEHDRFEFDRIEDVIERDRLQKRYRIFAKEIRDHIQTLAAYEIQDEFETDDMNDLLPGFFSAEAGEVDDESSARIKVGKQRKRKALEQGVLAGGDQIEVPGRGAIGGDGKRKTKGGSIPGDGTGRAKANSVGPASKLRVVRANSKSPTTVTVHFTAPKKGDAYLTLYRSGESESQEIPAQCVSDGKPVALHRVKWKFKSANTRTSISAEISVEDQGFAMTGVLSYVV